MRIEGIHDAFRRDQREMAVAKPFRGRFCSMRRQYQHGVNVGGDLKLDGGTRSGMAGTAARKEPVFLGPTAGSISLEQKIFKLNARDRPCAAGSSHTIGRRWASQHPAPSIPPPSAQSSAVKTNTAPFRGGIMLQKSAAKVSPFGSWEMAKLGYARVSTNGQDLAGQVADLQAAGCAKVYREKVSGAKTNRPELAKLLRAIEHGDVLIVCRLDRLARSTRDLLNILDAVAKAGAGFRSLKDSWADTTTAHGRLMLTILGGLASKR